MNNLVHIETFDSHGSGIIFPCERGADNSYIVITNYHVVSTLSKYQGNIKNKINLEIYDIQGNTVDKNLIRDVRLRSKPAYMMSNDIAVLLITCDNLVQLNLSTRVQKSIKGKSEIYTTGYPEILKDDEVNRRLTLEGQIEEIYPEVKNMGLYKVKEGYHFYNDITDKDLFDGLSGAPVYYKEDYTNIIIGMNQSISNVGAGKNPYNITYFITISHALRWLRLQGFIVYSILNGHLRVKWLEEKPENDTPKNILVLGSSGTGKSSFVKEFMYHGDLINSSGDGQTTRMDIDYKLHLKTDNPDVYVKFYSKEDFVDKMKDLMNMNFIEYALVNWFGFTKENADLNPSVYLQVLYNPLMALVSLTKSKFGEETHKKIIERAERHLKKASIYLINPHKIEKEKLYELYNDLISVMREVDTKIYRRNIDIVKIFSRQAFKDYKNKNVIEENDVEHELLHCTNFVEQVLNEVVVDRISNQADELNLFSCLNKYKGFFDISEFYYLDKSLEIAVSELTELYSEVMFDYYSFRGEDSDEKTTVDGYYDDLYELLWELVERRYEINNKKELRISLTNSKSAVLESLQHVLKVVKKDSVSSLVKKVQVNDLIADKYAYLFSDKSMHQINFVDTCGLDHIDRGSNIKKHLKHIFGEYKDNDIKFDAIFYLKKLDAGKPTELENILPMLFDTSPGTPVYTIFTGGDLYYKGREQLLLDYPWSQELYSNSEMFNEALIPKSASYIYGNDSLTGNIKCSKQWKNIIHDVIRNNLMPFVSGNHGVMDDVFTKSNTFYLEKLLDSILVDEWNSGYINVKVDIKKLDTDVKKALKEDIKRMFYASSIYSWSSRHHMTVNANIKRLLGETDNTQGYNGVFLDRWDYLFREGYQEAFLRGNSQTIDALTDKYAQRNVFESMFSKIRDRILKVDLVYHNTYKVEQSSFRKHLKEMYLNKEIYQNNPFVKEDKKLNNQAEKRAYLKDVCDFRKGLVQEKVLEDFCAVFENEIVNYLEKENLVQVERIISHKSELDDALDKVVSYAKKFAGTSKDVDINEILNKFLDVKLSKPRL